MAKHTICGRPTYGGNRHMAKTLLVMKMTFILLTVALLNVSAKGLSQSISFTGKNVSLKKIFTAIEKQTGYAVTYTDDVLTGARPVSVTAQNVSLRNFLVLILKGQPIDFSIEDKSILLFRKTAFTGPSAPPALADTAAQPIDVQGRVVNEKKEPVEGVTVQVKGLSKNTITNKNGEFVLSTIDPSATLVFTHISMEPLELRINRRTDLSVLLRTKVNALNNVTVTVSNGYQRIPKERATGSFDYLSNEVINKQVSTSILPRLEAIANGLTVDRISTGGGGRLSIRGLSSILGPKDPLIILDNFPYEGNLNNINPNDVEDITILKDAAAASIWGTRAGNGVIVITTKKAKFNQALKVEVNTNVTVGAKPDLYYIQQISSSDFIDAELFLFSNKHQFADTSSSQRTPFTPAYEILFKRRKGLISAADSAAQIDALRKIDLRDQFNKYVYRGAFNQQHAINISGGADKYSWLFSSGYDRNTDELDATFDRLNLRFQNTFKPVRNLSIQAGIYYTQSNTTSGKPAYGSLSSTTTGNGLAPYTQLADQYGNPLSIVKDYRSVYVDTAGAGKLLDWKYVPLDDYKHAMSKNRSSGVLINAGLGYQVFTGLNIDLQYQLERQTANNRTLNDAYSYLARYFVNKFTQINGNTVTNIVPKGGILDLSQALLQSSNLRGLLSYTRKWTKHAVTAILGGELRETNTTSTRLRQYGYNDNNNTYGVVDYTRTYPDYATGSNIFIQRTDGIGDQTNRAVSVFGNAAYTFLDRYTFSISGRRDGSNLFGATTNDKWKPLSSYGLSWEISKESFYRLAWLPLLKVRMTYGTSGSADATKVGLATINYRGLTNYLQLPYAAIENYYNPELKWETIRMTNIALDFSAFQNRLSGSVDYYIKKGEDLFGNTPVDYTAIGTTSLVRNVASMQVRGLDVNLNTKNIDGAFTWTTRVNVSLNRDKVTKYYQSTALGTRFVTSSLLIAGLEGKPVYSIFSYRWAGLDPSNGDLQGYLNKQVSKNYTSLINDSLNNLVYNGPALPRIFGSVSNTFSYKGLSLTAAILFKFKYYFRRPSINYNSMYNTWLGHADFADRWQKPGDEKTTNVPAMYYPGLSSRDQFYAGSEVLVEKGDHIRLQFVTLDYDVTRLIAKTNLFRSMQVYVNANNLSIIWRANDHHLDPEYYTGYSMPPAKTFAVGLRTIF